VGERKRGRELGLPFPGTPGHWNAITDVPGVEVGQVTLVLGEGALKVGHGPVRTGVTAILPRGKAKAHVPCAAGYYSLNGNGEMTGVVWIEESGELQTPITITNTHSCGVTRDATIRWLVGRGVGTGQDWGLPVAAETYDGDLNDINGFHVTAEHTMAALDGARSGPVAMGSVGGGTGMVAYEFKGGIGTASRVLAADLGGYTLGVLVQANHGVRRQLTLAGVPVGRELGGGQRRFAGSNPQDLAGLSVGETGSILIIVATDAPLLPHQLKRLARRASLGLARTGAISGNGSGDLFLAFSTANAGAQQGGLRQADFLANDALDPLFEATVQAGEEAIVNALVAAEDVLDGVDGRYAKAIDHAALVDLLKQYRRYRKPTKTP